MNNKNSGSEIWVQLKIWKAKQPAVTSYLHLNLKWRPCLQESQMRLHLGAVSPHLILLSRAGMKGMHHCHKGVHHPISMASSVATGLKVCATTAWSVRLTSGLFYSLIFRQSLFIKIQLKCHYTYWSFSHGEDFPRGRLVILFWSTGDCEIPDWKPNLGPL